MSNGPRVLTLDIETAPTLAWVWGLWDQNISLGQVVQPTRVICFAAKWADEKRVMFFSEYDKEDFIKKAFDLLDEADAVVTWNGDKFDLGHLNREFTEAGLGRPAPYQSIDLLKTVKKHHRFLSNKLAHVTDRLDLSGKLSHEGFGLWLKWMEGDEKAQRTMRKYNIQDVKTTEELYCELLPWIDNHPTFALYGDNVDATPSCPKCGSTNLQQRGWRYTRISRFKRFSCNDCGSWCSSGKREEGVDVR